MCDARAVKLSPRYGDDPVLVLDGVPGAVREPMARQVRRLGATLASLDDEQWAHPSRCDGWTVRDVVVHLESVMGFWAFSITSGLEGEPSRFLASFDPVATPAEMVAASSMSAPETRDRFAATTTGFLTVLEGLGAGDWSTPAEAPPGHIAIDALVHHALWDAWIHERDITIPLGLTPVAEPDEVTACLRYAIGLSPAFALTSGVAAKGTLTVAATRPDVAVLVEVSGGRVDVRDGGSLESADLTGDAVELVEALSYRRPFVAELAPERRWMIEGLAAVFDQDAP